MPAANEYTPIPPEVYAAATAWDPELERETFLVVAREEGVEPRSVLELGCGTGRLLAAWQAVDIAAVGVELSDAFAAFGRARGLPILAGDMRTLDAKRFEDANAPGPPFDLAYASANTIRHLLTRNDFAAMTNSLAPLLADRGLLLLDLEVGREHVRNECGKARTWTLSGDEHEITGSWRHDALNETTGVCTLTYSFTRLPRDGRAPEHWETAFKLRAAEGPEIVADFAASGAFALAASYDLRWPYIQPRPVEKLNGRSLLVLRRRRA